MSHLVYNSMHRKGTTILEVLFAIGIVVIGILGIASLLPVAARNANLANESSEGQAYAQRYYADFVIRGFNRTGQWRAFNDLTKSYTLFSNSASPLTGTSVGSTRTRNRHAVCIDPGFFADALTLSEIRVGTFGPGQAYRPGLFPYYQDNFNPLSNPSDVPPALSFYNTGSMADDRARLLRVSLVSPITGSVISAKQVEQLFLSSDDISIATDDTDKTIPPTRIFDLTGGRGMSATLYSWLATLVPREYALGEMQDTSTPESRYTLAIVVMHRRDRSFFVPTGTTSRDMPQGERVLAITASPGSFAGGNAGRITVSANAEVDDTLRIGDWMMLTRYSSAAPTRMVIARWYRVIGVDPDATKAAGIWSKNVVLEGPDWVFSPLDPLMAPLDECFDQATVVSNVVTVLERVVDVQQ